MEFRTLVELPKKELSINHSHKIVTIGSCFADNIGQKLVENKFQCIVNPFGILYNPSSIEDQLTRIWREKEYTDKDVFFHNGLWHSYFHHGSFSDVSKEQCLKNINDKLWEMKEEMKTVDYVIVTLGSSFVYVHKKTGYIVGNCHKLPEKDFRRVCMDPEDLMNSLDWIVEIVNNRIGSAKVIFTVSPIRHLKDGLQANSVSKGCLFSALYNRIFTGIFTSIYDGQFFYFPAYEVMMDELRDYRFYADDMVHPSALAIDYIWECFSKSYFDKNTVSLLKEWEEIKKGLNHKPFHADSEEYKTFLRQIVLKIERIKEKCPNLDVEKELELCHILLKQ